MKAALRLSALAVMLLLAQPSLAAAAGQDAAAGQAAGFFMGLAVGFLICLLLSCWPI